MEADPLNIEFGRRLGELRERTSLSQEQLGRKASISRASIVNIERGRQSVSLATLYRLAGALNCGPADLLPTVQPASKPRLAIGYDTPDTDKAISAVMRHAFKDSPA